MALAALYVTIGMTWGIIMSASGDHMLAGAHAHLNLVGWVTTAIFAIYYHLVPKAGDAMLAKIHLAVGTLGVVTLVPGIVMAIQRQGEMLAQIGSVLTLLSMLIFLVTVLRNRG